MRKTIVTTNTTDPVGLIRQLFSNIEYLDEDDLEVIAFLGTKGAYPDKKVIFENKSNITENICYKTEEPCDCSGLCRENY
jgi:hypothetical protein